MHKRKLKVNKDLLAISLPALALVFGALAVTLLFMRPAPPKEIVMAIGAAHGTYHAHALKYRDALEREGVKLHLRPSAGSIENLRLLRDPASGVAVAFVQGGVATASNAPEVVSLGSMYFEPLWVFHRRELKLETLGGLRGKMVAVGAQDGGTAALALTLLQRFGITGAPTSLLKLGGRPAANLLISGGIDAAFFMADAQTPLIQELIHRPDLRLMNFDRADAFTRQHYFLSRLLLPRGVFDVEGDIPDRDTVLVGTTANLLVRKDLHPALAYLLLRTASDLHSKPTLFSGLRQFPMANDTELPLSPEAIRYYRSGSPWLQRHLPFWAANLVDRLLLLLVPAVAVLFPAMRLLPALYRWRVSSRIYRWYARLKEIELELEERRTGQQLRDILERLDGIEDAVNHIDTPLAYSENLYVFRQHIDLVRQRAQSRLLPSSHAREAVSSAEAS
jgi:TRAP transporter TAXI family solute receptor